MAANVKEGTSMPPHPPSVTKKTMPSLHELKRRSTSAVDEVYSRSGRSDESSMSGATERNADGSIKRKADSLEGSLHANDENQTDGFFECEPGVSPNQPPSKKKNETTTARLMAQVNGKARLRYWDSADNLAI